MSTEEFVYGCLELKDSMVTSCQLPVRRHFTGILGICCLFLGSSDNLGNISVRVIRHNL